MFEKVNPQHPDKVADRIAGAIVDLAYKAVGGFDAPNPKVAVEVLLGHGRCNVIIETSLGRKELRSEDVEAAVKRIAGNVEPRVMLVAQDKLLAENQATEIRCGDNGVFKGMPTTAEQEELTGLAKALYGQFPYDGKYVLACGRFIICQSNASFDKVHNLFNAYCEDKDFCHTAVRINPLGDWTGGADVDCGATNRKLGSDMGDAVTGGGLHGKDLSKADVSVNIVCHILAKAAKQPVLAYCAIGDERVSFYYENGREQRMNYREVVQAARLYLENHFGGSFEKFAEWGLIY